jgi:heat shock protein HtpX
MNGVKTVFLLTLMTLLAWWVGVLLFPDGGFYIGLGFAALLNLGAYFFSDKIALAASRARPVEYSDLPEVYDIVNRLTQNLGMPMPRLYLIDAPQPNAFATGRSPNHAAVAVTTGILQVLDRYELEGVLAHELAHVANRDILISSVAAMFAAAISMLTRMAFWFGGGRDRNNGVGAVLTLVAFIVAPLAAMLIRFAISRAREYQADESGAQYTGNPLQLASALRKIGAATQQIPMDVNPAVSSLYIENPRKALKGNGIGKLFSTHPPMEERIARLEQMAGPISR